MLSKTHVVTVRDNSFNPATVVIEAGDTVRWVNAGPGAHNVYSMGRFRCANGCDANAGDGSPSSDLWVAEVTFRIPETVPYECQPHVQFGMVGTVVVQNPSSTTTHQITANPDNTFTPDHLHIMAGDVVYINNQGGEHNFQADDDSIICADGCEGDGQSVDSDPTGFQWELYRRFDTPRLIRYHCANPNHSAQTGVLKVISDVLFSHGFD
ncbi:cupredoxin domain-containing protein [Marinicella litoralis]|uniref:cupredoxin domain-containing protein n=1 Tax=Marinicella litoralis TaxID=644220 RepID=UPI0013C30B5E|nr:plastocyanin/azurin family copper-binding protein [Marinicella litoralis]